VYFRSIKELKNPETEALRLAVSVSMFTSWKDTKDVRLHSSKDLIIEGWLMGLVDFIVSNGPQDPTKGYCV